ncbi:hypothetical protein ACV229_21355 [Burkholderia sp. MR1-5-21]
MPERESERRASHAPSPSRPHHPVLVRDLPTQMFHWLLGLLGLLGLLVLLVAAAYVTVRLDWLDLHVRVGETLPLDIAEQHHVRNERVELMSWLSRMSFSYALLFLHRIILYRTKQFYSFARFIGVEQ